MGFSSRKMARMISTLASRLYLCIIFAQISLFRFPCQIGTCETPIDVLACQLIASGSFSKLVIMAILYPGAIKKSFMQGTHIPSSYQLWNSYKSKMRNLHAASDPNYLQVITGSYLCVAGALLGLIKHGRMSLFGLILIQWGIATEMLSRRDASNPSETLGIYPEMIITTIIAFFTVNGDVRKLIKIINLGDVCKLLRKCFRAKHY